MFLISSVPLLTPPRARARRGPLVCGLVALALVWPLSCSGPDLREEGQRAGRVAVLPIVSRAGVDLTALPATAWESLGTLRLVVRLDQSSAPLAALPFRDDALPADLDPAVLANLTYERRRAQLLWREQMSDATRDLLLGLSPDRAWQTAINRLYDQATPRTVDLAAALHETLARALRNAGVEAEATGAPFPSASAPATDAFAAQRAAATAAGYDAVALLTITRFEFTHAFDTGAIRLGAALHLVDAPTGALLAQTVVPDFTYALANGSGTPTVGVMLDLASLAPPLAARIVRAVLGIERGDEGDSSSRAENLAP